MEIPNHISSCDDRTECDIIASIYSGNNNNNDKQEVAEPGKSPNTSDRTYNNAGDETFQDCADACINDLPPWVGHVSDGWSVNENPVIGDLGGVRTIGSIQYSENREICGVLAGDTAHRVSDTAVISGIQQADTNDDGELNPNKLYTQHAEVVPNGVISSPDWPLSEHPNSNGAVERSNGTLNHSDKVALPPVYGIPSASINKKLDETLQCRRLNDTEPVCDTQDLASCLNDNGNSSDCDVTMVTKERMKDDTNSLPKKSKSTFPCLVCGKSFVSKGNLIIHTRLHTGERPFPCPVCDKTFTSKASCDYHLISHTEDKSRECSSCGETFKRQDTLTKHIQVVHKGVTFQCPVCDKVVTRVGSLRKHMKLHAGIKPFKCTVCGQMFARNHHLKCHMMIHTNEKPHKCTTCGRGFARATGLTAHVRTHTGEKPFVCEFCQKRFTLIADMKNHERIHTGEKPFKCEKCSKCFSRRANLAVHRKSHQTAMPYQCAICNQRFKQPVTKLHMAKHTGEPVVKNFTCSECPKSFTQSYNLLSHMKYIHTHDRAYVCPECGQDFVAKRELERHMMIHSGERPFMCPTCGKTFNRAHHLRKHVLVMHTNVKTEIKSEIKSEVKSEINYEMKSDCDSHVGGNIANHIIRKHFPCFHCDKVLPTCRGMKIHIKKVHVKKEICIKKEIP